MAASNQDQKVCIIIPAFNEADSIIHVIESIQQLHKPYHLVVINDGSTDKTSQKVREKGVEVVELPFNLGIGGAVQTGLKYAYNHGFEFSLQVDADGQHNPKYIAKIISACDKDTDMVIGSRYLINTSYKSTPMRLLGVSIFSFLIQVITGRHIYDCTSGLRLMNRRAMSFLIHNFPIDFPEPESIVKLLRNGYRIKEVPVEMGNRLAGSSSVTAFKAIYFMLSISVAILIEGIKSKHKNHV